MQFTHLNFGCSFDCYIGLFVINVQEFLVLLQMRTGLRLMFARRFWPSWAAVIVCGPGALTVGLLAKREWDREAYAMRGRSNLFKADHIKLKELHPSRELWK